MQPRIELLSKDIIERVLGEAFQLLINPGIKVQSREARMLLASAGAKVDDAQEIAHIPQSVARKALESVPHEFFLYNRTGKPVVRYGGDAVHFDPGSSGVHSLDPHTLEHHPSYTPDLVNIIKIADILPQYDAQSTAIVCN
jgi:trimethylamine--corrinoid protein Co-methyltransferase